jgi:hypothetical protein
LNRQRPYLSEFGCAAKPASPTLAGAERMVDSDQSDTEPEKDGQQNHVFPISKQRLASKRWRQPRNRAPKGCKAFVNPVERRIRFRTIRS